MSWIVRRGEKPYYCIVSGGYARKDFVCVCVCVCGVHIHTHTYTQLLHSYVIFGHWMHGVPLSNTDEHCVLEAFMKGQFHPQIKEVRSPRRQCVRSFCFCPPLSSLAAGSDQ